MDTQEKFALAGRLERLAAKLKKQAGQARSIASDEFDDGGASAYDSAAYDVLKLADEIWAGERPLANDWPKLPPEGVDCVAGRIEKLAEEFRECPKDNPSWSRQAASLCDNLAGSVRIRRTE